MKEYLFLTSQVHTWIQCIKLNAFIEKLQLFVDIVNDCLHLTYENSLALGAVHTKETSFVKPVPSPLTKMYSFHCNGWIRKKRGSNSDIWLHRALQRK